MTAIIDQVILLKTLKNKKIKSTICLLELKKLYIYWDKVAMDDKLLRKMTNR